MSKIELSNQAIKAAAHAIGKSIELAHDPEITGRRAAQAALRTDAKFRFPGIDGPDEAQITLHYGADGSGTTEARISYTREALRCGFRAIFLDSFIYNAIPRFYRDEFHLVTDDTDLGQLTLDENLYADARGLFFSYPCPMRNIEDRRVPLIEELEKFDAELPTVIITDSVMPGICKPILDLIKSRPAWGFYGCAYDLGSVADELHRAADQIICGRTCKNHGHDVPENIHLDELGEGEGYIHRGRMRGKLVVFPHSSATRSTHSKTRLQYSMSCGAMALAGGIANMIETNCTKSHTDRLEFVSYVAGYRGWHAAAGRALPQDGRWTEAESLYL